MRWMEGGGEIKERAVDACCGPFMLGERMEGRGEEVGVVTEKKGVGGLNGRRDKKVRRERGEMESNGRALDGKVNEAEWGGV